MAEEEAVAIEAVGEDAAVALAEEGEEEVEAGDEGGAFEEVVEEGFGEEEEEASSTVGPKMKFSKKWGLPVKRRSALQWKVVATANWRPSTLACRRTNSNKIGKLTC